MRRPQRTVTLCAFDVLWLDGIDCTQLPYRDRRRVLEDARVVWAGLVHRAALSDRRRRGLLDACARLRQEGIVLKRVDARYTPGVRTADWRKVKTAAWRTNHGPRRLPKEVSDRIYG
jgi:bifunctional non-homologous end joining protein LigD